MHGTLGLAIMPERGMPMDVSSSKLAQQAADENILDSGHVLQRAQFLRERGDVGIRQSARHNAGEEREVCVDVEGEPVERHMARNADADGAYLCVPDPDASVAWIPPRRQAKDRHGLDYGLFQPRDIVADPDSPRGEIDDGIGDNLSGAVEGDATAAVRFDQIDAFRPKDFFSPEKMAGHSRSSKRIDRSMFNDEDCVANPSGASIGMKGTLKAEPLPIGCQAPFDMDGNPLIGTVHCRKAKCKTS